MDFFSLFSFSELSYKYHKNFQIFRKLRLSKTEDYEVLIFPTKIIYITMNFPSWLLLIDVRPFILQKNGKFGIFK